MQAIVSEKGQVTIPKAVRQRLGLRPGVVVEFFEENGRLVGRKIDPQSDPVAAVTGIVKSLNVDDHLDRTRGPAA